MRKRIKTNQHCGVKYILRFGFVNKNCNFAIIFSFKELPSSFFNSSQSSVSWAISCSDHSFGSLFCTSLRTACNNFCFREYFKFILSLLKSFAKRKFLLDVVKWRFVLGYLELEESLKVMYFCKISFRQLSRNFFIFSLITFGDLFSKNFSSSSGIDSFEKVFFFFDKILEK